MAAPPDLAGYTLLVPALGLGNVCQLALDLVINSLLTAAPPGSVAHALTLPSDAVAPTAGARPFSAPVPRASGGGATVDVATSLELYVVPAARVAVLQQRAPAYEGHHEALALQVARFARAAGVARVVAVTAIDAALRGDAELAAAAAAAAPVAVYVATAPDAAASETLRLPSWCGADGRALPTAATAGASDAADAASAAAPVPPGWEPLAPGAVAATRSLLSQALGTGFTAVLYRRLLSDALLAAAAGSSTPPPPAFTALMMFAAEGDNSADAAGLAGLLVRYCGGFGGLLGDGAKLTPPPYWDRLHGPGFDQALYG